MELLCRALLISLLATGFASTAPAQDRQPGRIAPNTVTNMPASLTGKERLGRKWMDEQRLDNCNVPVDKRGTKPRPSTCLHAPTG